MNRIVNIIILVCLVSACIPEDENSIPPTVQADGPANAWRPATVSIGTSIPPTSAVAKPQTAGSNPGPSQVEAPALRTAKGLDLGDKWPSGKDMLAMADDFMTAGFMKNEKPIGFGDLAYTDIFLDFSLDEQGRIDQLDGVVSDMYDQYSFGIPVVPRGSYAISGSRQVNWEDGIVQLGADRWSVQPVSRKGAGPYEVVLKNGIEFRYGPESIRISKTGAVFSCVQSRIGTGGQEEQPLSWTLGQYERGPARILHSLGELRVEVPVVMVWEPGFLAGYLVSLPEGRAEFMHTLKWVSTGDIQTDRYNFLVLLTQHRGAGPRIPDSLGAVDPVWLALLMYDHVVTP